MSNVDDKIDKILKEVAESAWSLGLQTAPKDNLYNDRNNRMTPYKAKQAITTLIAQSERKARIDEWKLISEVQHSAGITAELYFGKERDERINQLTNEENK